MRSNKNNLGGHGDEEGVAHCHDCLAGKSQPESERKCQNVKETKCDQLNLINNQNLVTGETSSVSPGRVDRKRVREPINIQDEPHRTPAYNKHGPQCPASLEMRDSEFESTQVILWPADGEASAWDLANTNRNKQKGECFLF